MEEASDDLFAGRRVQAALPHGPCYVLKTFGCLMDVRRSWWAFVLGSCRSRMCIGVSCSARVLGACLRDRSGHFEELGAHAGMRLLTVFGADEMFETLYRGKYELRVGVSIPSGIFLEKPPAARTLHHRGANGVVIALLGRKRRNCGERERFFRHGVRVY